MDRWMGGGWTGEWMDKWVDMSHVGPNDWPTVAEE